MKSKSAFREIGYSRSLLTVQCPHGAVQQCVLYSQSWWQYHPTVSSLCCYIKPQGHCTIYTVYPTLSWVMGVHPGSQGSFFISSQRTQGSDPEQLISAAALYLSTTEPHSSTAESISSSLHHPPPPPPLPVTPSSGSRACPRSTPKPQTSEILMVW